jgi:hypothetical protein
LDDTEDYRTVIVNTDTDKDQFERLQCDLNWSLQQLIDFLKHKLQLQPG